MASRLTYIRTLSSLEETDRFASTLAPLLRSGDVVMLNGTLGAGKTRFVQGVAAALGIHDDVTSPTFNILLSYEGRDIELNHFDLYRLETEDQLEDIGYWDVLEGDGVSFIEWGDRFPDDQPIDFIELAISVEDGQTRTVRVRACGERAQCLLLSWANDKNAQLRKIDG